MFSIVFGAMDNHLALELFQSLNSPRVHKFAYTDLHE